MEEGRAVYQFSIEGCLAAVCAAARAGLRARILMPFLAPCCALLRPVAACCGLLRPVAACCPRFASDCPPRRRCAARGCCGAMRVAAPVATHVLHARAHTRTDTRARARARQAGAGHVRAGGVGAVAGGEAQRQLEDRPPPHPRREAQDSGGALLL